jgi:hypothetical protein
MVKEKRDGRLKFLIPKTWVCWDSARSPAPRSPGLGFHYHYYCAGASGGRVRASFRRILSRCNYGVQRWIGEYSNHGLWACTSFAWTGRDKRLDRMMLFRFAVIWIGSIPVPHATKGSEESQRMMQGLGSDVPGSWVLKHWPILFSRGCATPEPLFA